MGRARQRQQAGMVRGDANRFVMRAGKLRCGRCMD
ncbi:hypothetical protein CJF30_00010557 [Rutstroemia sp. NJR-2017a BBW]|nr:hypothetical protein CJF30_00010557 [Rutstroemia sp. NJR-2017a BBW]